MPEPAQHTARGGPLVSAELRDIAPRLGQRLNVRQEDVDSGLAKLVLSLIEFIRQILEHQAVRRMEGGTLTDEEIERLGMALLRLKQRMDELREVFGLREEDLRLDLGPLGRLT